MEKGTHAKRGDNDIQVGDDDAVDGMCEIPWLWNEGEVWKSSLVLVAHVHTAVEHNVFASHSHDHTTLPHILPRPCQARTITHTHTHLHYHTTFTSTYISFTITRTYLHTYPSQSHILLHTHISFTIISSTPNFNYSILNTPRPPNQTLQYYSLHRPSLNNENLPIVTKQSKSKHSYTHISFTTISTPPNFNSSILNPHTSISSVPFPHSPLLKQKSTHHY